MKLRISYILMLLSVLALSLSGCQRDDDDRNTGYGTMNIQLSANPSVIEVGASSNTRGKSDSIKTTRADGIVPEAKDFRLAICKGEEEIKSWNTFAEFSPTDKIPVGEFTLKASYGDSKKEGFDSPYYEGSVPVRIVDKEDTPVDLTCYLARVQLTVNCSEAVQKYFKSFKMQVRSSAGTPIDISKTETRSAYLQSGLLVLEAQLEKQNGTTSKLELLRVAATEARQHYIVNVDVNGGDVGSGTLNVTYHTVKSEEKVEIDLSDASLNIKAPEFTASGIENGGGVTLSEGAQPDGLKITLNARAGIRHCDLIINSPYLNSSEVGIAQTIELVPAEEAGKAAKQKVVDKGLRLLGLEESIEKLALIDFTQLVMNMLCVSDADETSTFTLRATDKRGVVQEQEFSFNTTLQSNLFSLPAIEKTVMIGGTEAETTINLLTSGVTGEQDVNNVIFEYKNASGVWAAAETEWVSDDATEIKKHTVKIKKLPEVYRNLTLRARYGSKTSVEQTLSYYIPDFTITAEPADIWARKATMKVEANSIAERDAVLKYLKLIYDGKEIPTTKKDNTFLWTGLTPGQTYKVIGVCNAGGEVSLSKDYDLETEKNLQLPNCNFESWQVKPYNNGNKINWGGPWSKLADYLVYWNGESTYEQKTIEAKEPVGWVTVNSKTMPNNPSEMNTWYIVPTTDQTNSIVSDGNTSVLVRNVAWSSSGRAIPVYGEIGKWASKDKCYKTFPGFNVLNPPTIDLSNSAGRLFLGAYSYNHSTGVDIYTEGYSFVCRPLKMTFKYKYISKTSGVIAKDQAYVRVMLRKGTMSIFKDKEFIDLELDPTSNVLTKSVEFLYPSEECEKPDNICVMFCSSIKGKSMKQSEEKVDNPSKESCISQACVTGSELYIDDIELIY